MRLAEVRSRQVAHGVVMGASSTSATLAELYPHSREFWMGAGRRPKRKPVGEAGPVRVSIKEAAPPPDQASSVFSPLGYGETKEEIEQYILYAASRSGAGSFYGLVAEPIRMPRMTLTSRLTRIMVVNT